MKLISNLYEIFLDRWGFRQNKLFHIKNEGVFKGNVLLSYITDPFRYNSPDDIPATHTNGWECNQMAVIWSNHGYAVDIINWDNTTFIPKKKYSFFIDIHSNMERLSPVLNKDCMKILHITGAHWLYQNSAEYQRTLALQRRRGCTLTPKRLAPPSYGIECADCATILGNEFTRTTFSFAQKPIYRTPISTTNLYPKFDDKDYDSCKKNYLWFGGSGLVHKGLDLVLEAFSQMPDYNLVVCGPIQHEKDFETCYYRELYETGNIRTIGWVDTSSHEFIEIVKNCVGLLYPSCSEGGGGSVITCLHAGLIPIVSYESSVDVRDDFGLILKKNTVEEIIHSITYISGLSQELLNQMSKTAREFAREHHTKENFENHYSSFVDKVTML